MERNSLIDGWRGLSVSLVVVGHFLIACFGSDAIGIPFRVLLTPPIDWSAVAVNIAKRFTYLLPMVGVQTFFVISGYLITSILLREEDREGNVSLAAFYARRSFRILPAYLAFLLCATIGMLAGILPVTLRDVTTAATFLCNTSLGCSYGLSHTWSLAIEEQFYLAWPIMFMALGRQRRVPALYMIIAAFLTASGAGMLHVDWIDNGVFFASIAIGALYASSTQLQGWISHLARPLTLTLAALLISALPFLASLGASHYLMLLTPFLTGFLFFGSFTAARPLRRILSSFPLRTLGLISFSVYLWQQLFTYPIESPSFLAVVGKVVMILAIASVSYLLIERPMIGAGRQLSNAIIRGRRQCVITAPSQF